MAYSTKRWTCEEIKLKIKQSREKYKEKANKQKRDKYKNNPNFKKECNERSKKNKNSVKKWRENNPNYMSQYMKNRRKEKPEVVKSEERLKHSKRKCGKLYKLFLKELKIIFSNKPENKVVDHIIPLQGKNVSGLHVPWNLQYLDWDKNCFKRNKFDFTYDNTSWEQDFIKKVKYKKV